ncbi:MAG: TetR family transcriptional regulator [Mycobacterium sp.]|jgi:AcrR family transcriptional regulator
MHRGQVQRRVFEAFATLMAEHSFDAITMAKLAAASRIGRTAIYHHFADVVAIEDVLREILTDAATAGQFTVEGEAATMSLIHACLAPCDLSTGVIERFVLRALGAIP